MECGNICETDTTFVKMGLPCDIKVIKVITVRRYRLTVHGSETKFNYVG